MMDRQIMDRQIAIAPGHRVVVLLLAIAAAAIGTADRAAAQPINGSARWCVTLSHFGGTLDCAYHSLEQCMAAASGVSNRCSTNPWYVERRGGRPQRPEPRR